MSEQLNKNPVIAHRGAFKKNGFPENSIAALNEAIRLKCIGSEFDVHMTADEVLVVSHDPHFYKLDIEKSTYSQLAAFRLSNGEPLPTLLHYLKAGKMNNDSTKMILEIKPSGISKERGLEITEHCVALVADEGMTDQTTYISFDYDILKRINKISPASETQYLNGDKSPEELKADKISGADYHYSVFRKNSDWIKSAKEHRLVLNAWTVNSKADMLWLLENEFDYITTNEPELLFELIRERAGGKR